MIDEQDTPLRRARRRASVGAAGVTTIAVGVALIPLPGPGTLIILGQALGMFLLIVLLMHVQLRKNGGAS